MVYDSAFLAHYFFIVVVAESHNAPFHRFHISFGHQFRNFLKEQGIELRAKPLGRPKALSNQVRPGERNPIEGKFGQAKRGYGFDKIRAMLTSTSESWISTIILVLNLVKLAGVALYCLIQNILSALKQNCNLQTNQFLLSFYAGRSQMVQAIG